jgi:hypothetical protein
MSRDATSAVISPFSTPTSCIDHAITESALRRRVPDRLCGAV